jgi:VanZ family protein
MLSRLKYWLPAILVALLISLFSTQYFSSEQTARVILPILQWLFPSASHHLLHLMHVGIRKAAHITEFAVFSIAVFHGVRADRYGWRLDWAVITLLIAVSYAGLDEWHQSFVPVREARFRDVLIDSTGALLAQVFVWAYTKLHRNSADSPEPRVTTG